jgi:hypothetical protein
MIISGPGKFCQSCQKQVHDFGRSSGEEIKKAYRDHSGNICGRIPARLLQEQFEDRQLRKLHAGTLRRLFFAALFCFGSSLFTIDAAKASTIYKLKLSFFSSLAIPDSSTICGTVKNAEGKGDLAFATVEIFHGQKRIARTQTNSKGYYSIKVSDTYKKVDVVVSYAGFKNESVKGIAISPQKRANVDIRMRYEEEILMGDVDWDPNDTLH